MTAVLAPRLHVGRLGLLLPAGAALLAGLHTGLVRAGVLDGSRLAAQHGPLLVLGFLGTLIALERAVGFRVRWGYAAPVLAAAGVVSLLAGGPAMVAALLLALAGATVTALFVVHGRGHWQPHLALLAAGGVAWTAASVWWALGPGPVRLMPMLAAFLVLTVLGERLELSRLGGPPRQAMWRGVVAAGVVGVGAALTVVARPAGLVVGGLGLLASAGWFARHDLARATIRGRGLARFAAACMLAGYAWLAVAGALWLALGAGVGSALIYDAAVHALFLGFVMSMVIGHAPIVLPAVLRIELPHRGVAWAPLLALHATVALRVGADLVGSPSGRAVAGVGNVVALALFLAVAIGIAAAARRVARPRASQPTRADTRPPRKGALPL